MAAAIITPNKVRAGIYKLWGVNTRSLISHSCYLKSKKLTIGRSTFINTNCYFDNGAEVKIGDRCSIAMHVHFITSTHESGDSESRAGKAINKPITVGNGTWIGARTTILPGVNIAEGCIIASGSVVVKDCQAHGLYGGIPARRIKDLPVPNELKQAKMIQ